MKAIKTTNTAEYQHILNKRNPFQIVISEQRMARVTQTKAQEERFLKSREIKPTPNPVYNVTNGSFFK